jgi:hypothetical protein
MVHTEATFRLTFIFDFQNASLPTSVNNRNVGKIPTYNILISHLIYMARHATIFNTECHHFFYKCAAKALFHITEI